VTWGAHLPVAAVSPSGFSSVMPSVGFSPVLQCVAVCCSVLQRVAVCYRVLQCVGVCCSVLQLVRRCRLLASLLCCNVLQRLAVC